MQNLKTSNDTRLAELLSSGNVKNILILKQHNQFGDMLCTLPLFAAVRKKFPDAFITLVVSPGNYKILEGENPYIDKFLVYDKFSYIDLAKFYRKLRKIRYDIGIVPATVGISRTSHIINFTTGAKVRVGVESVNGKQNKSKKMLNLKKDFDWRGKEVHQSEMYLDIVRQIGCDLTIAEKKKIYLKYSTEEIAFAKKYFNKNFTDKSRPVVAFQPGAGKAENRWNTDKFTELIKKLYGEYNCYVFMITGPLDIKIVDELKKKLSIQNIECTVTSQQIRESSIMLALADLYITNDTGTMHSAAYSGAKVLSLFGHTKGWEWAPEKDNCKYLQSPTDNINDLSSEKVFSKAKEMLKNKKVVH